MVVVNGSFQLRISIKNSCLVAILTMWAQHSPCAHMTLRHLIAVNGTTTFRYRAYSILLVKLGNFTNLVHADR